MVSFRSPQAALAWSMDIQERLLDLNWPNDILEHRSGCVVLPNADDTTCKVKYLFRGLRVRIGIHTGFPEVEYNARTQAYCTRCVLYQMRGRREAGGGGGRVILSCLWLHGYNGAQISLKAPERREK